MAVRWDVHGERDLAEVVARPQDGLAPRLSCVTESIPLSTT
jgi:hypothetical protein